MISYKDFNDQLKRLYDSQTLQRQGSVSLVLHKNDSVVMQISVPHTVTKESPALSHLELKITYSPVYQEPLLLLRLWRRDSSQDDMTDLVSPWFPQDIRALLGIDKSFQVELDAVVSPVSHFQETWYSIHPCDTAEIVGDQVQYVDGYLERWFSVFVFSWLVRFEKKSE